jgi:O-antigen/teichoic acid export membrane protein
MFSTGTMAAFGFVFWLVAAHLYKPTQVGIASTLISSMNFIAYFCLLGFNSTFIRFLPHSKKRDEQIDTGLILVLLATILVATIYVIAAPFFAPKLGLLHAHIGYAIAYVILSVGATINLITDSVFIAYRAAVYNFFIDGIAGSSIQLLLPIALVSLGAFGIYTAQGVAATVAMILSIVFMIKRFHYHPSLKINKSVLREVLHYSSGNYVASLLNTAPTIVLPIIILDTLGAAPAGYYYLAFMMANVLYAVSYAVAQSLFAEGSTNEAALKHLVTRAAKFISVLVVPASIGLVILGPIFLDFFGKTYGAHAKDLLFVLALAGPVMGGVGICSIIMRITKQTKALVIANAIYLVVTCGSGLLWIHKGLVWAGVSWLLGQSVTLLVMLPPVTPQGRRLLATTSRFLQSPVR